MDRDEFMELVYETFADEPDNVLANGIIEAADAYAEHEKAQLSKGDATSDLISRRAAIRWVKTECNPYGKPTLDFESGKKVIEYLEQMPPAKPEPPIIKCKDCKWWRKQKDSAQGRCRLLGIYPTGAWYCGNAERRTE